MAGGEEEWEEGGVAIASIADVDVVAGAGVADVDVIATTSYIFEDAALSAVISSLPGPSSIVTACSHQHANLQIYLSSFAFSLAVTTA